MTTHFQLFDLPENATEEQIKTRYKQLASRCHPDKGGSAQLMILIKNSYQKLLLGEGAIAIEQSLDDSNKQVLALKKTIHQQQFYIQKLSVAIAKQAQIKETKRLKKILMPALVGILAVVAVVLANGWYQSNQQLNKVSKQLTTTINNSNKPAKPTMPALSQENLAKTWELKQKLRLSSARQQYLESDFDMSLTLIRALLNQHSAKALNQAQQQFLLQQHIEIPPVIDNEAVIDESAAVKNSIEENSTKAQQTEEQQIEEVDLDGEPRAVLLESLDVSAANATTN
ncbi:DnaJ domain-containing protein [Agarivorans sp. B2Z047]|uniref:J domain-containing protein n=1 Tax=Agarivorans sp. B2Z047 TaxID=2652721 RepID=UPI00128E18A3|nr:J domain-containing protein [Agarivorans sp. B2Z047]MPW29553.1 DnaJ domain-containing protein [Agarivorans sp. B2Z047]UQN45141.1 J domain-containing protein [Agarivorans sp. B2Z047]